MFRNMVTSLFKHERIRTTDAKAKEIRRWADQLVTLAKRGDLHARRQALSIIQEKDVVHKLFEEAPKRFAEVNGGYTRVVKIGFRPGDAASISMVELVTPEIKKKKARRKKKAKTAVASSATPPKAVTPEVKDEGPTAADEALKTTDAATDSSEAVKAKTPAETVDATEAAPVQVKAAPAVEEQAVTEASPAENTDEKATAAAADDEASEKTPKKDA